MAENLNFNLFDELENQDPRAEHYFNSRLYFYQQSLKRQSLSVSLKEEDIDEGNPTPGRIFLSKVPSIILDKSLKDILSEFGSITDYCRQRDVKIGIPDMTYLHASYGSRSEASSALTEIRKLDLGAGKIRAEFANDKGKKERERLTQEETQIQKEKELELQYLYRLRERQSLLENFEAQIQSKKIMIPTRQLPNHHLPILFHDINSENQLKFLSDGLFSVHANDEEGQSMTGPVLKLEQAIEDSRDTIINSPMPDDLDLGSEVFAYYIDTFYRAVVLEFPSEGQVQVWFVDFCNVSNVQFQFLRVLPQSFKEICPRLGHMCKLDGIAPLGSQEFSEAAIRWMTDFVTGDKKKVEIEIVGVEEKPNLTVNLARILVIDSELQSTTSLSDEMIRNNVARSTSSCQIRFPVKYNDMKPRSFSSARQFPCMVTSLENPNSFWLTSENESPQLQQLQRQLKMYGDKQSPLPPTISPEVDTMIVAYWTDGDSAGTLYRAVVLEGKKSQEAKIRVRFVDYGNDDIIDLSNIRILEPHMAELEMQALNCTLTNCKPQNGVEWDLAVNKHFIEMASVERPLMCEVRSTEEITGKFRIILRNSQFIINKEMLHRELAVEDSGGVRVTQPSAQRMPHPGPRHAIGLGGPRGPGGYGGPPPRFPSGPRNSLHGPPFNGPPPRYPPSHGQPSHTQNFPPRSRTPVCFKCREPGHIAPYCPQNIEQPQPFHNTAAPLVESRLSPLSSAMPEEPSQVRQAVPIGINRPSSVVSNMSSLSLMSNDTVIPSTSYLNTDLHNRITHLEKEVADLKAASDEKDARLKEYVQIIESQKRDSEKLTNLEAEIKLLKRSHETLERDLIKKGHL